MRFFSDYAKDQLLGSIKTTLENYGITFDVWFSELSLHTTNQVVATLALLEQKNYIYTCDNALWFRSTDFGDDKDRVVQKSSGETNLCGCR